MLAFAHTKDMAGGALRSWSAAVVLVIAVAAAGPSAQRAGTSRDPATLRRSSGLLTLTRDGRLLIASSARIDQLPGLIDRIGAFVFGGKSAPAYDSAALCLARLTPDGAPDPGFGTNGSIVTPLLPLDNHDRVTVTALLEDASGRAVVVGWRPMSTFLDANFPVIVVARYSASGTLDPSFGERGIVTTRVDEAGATQAFAAALDSDGRLLVAGYNGGLKSKSGDSFDNWPVRLILLRYTASGALDTSFGTKGIASHVLVPPGPDGRAGRDFLLYDYKHTKTAGLVLDRQGRAVVAAAPDKGPIVLVRFTREGTVDSGFGSAGTTQTPIGTRSGISTLFWDAEGRLMAAGTSDDSAVLLRYSADGALDATFGERGIRRAPIGEGLRVSAALQDANGRLLVAASGGNTVHLARYDASGTPDQTFGSSGAISTKVDRTVATTAGLAIDDKGTPVVTVVAANGVFLLRHNREGSVDKSFVSVPKAHP